MIFALLTTCFFAGSAVAANRAIGTFGSLKTNALRLLIVVAWGTLWATFFGSGALGIGARWMLVSGVVGFGLGDIGLFLALPRLGSRLSVLMTQCLAVPLAACAEWMWRGTMLTHTQSVASLLILSGVALALAPERQSELPSQVSWVGVALGVLSAAGQGGGAVISRYAFDVVQQSGGMLDALTATWQRASGGVVVALLAWWWLDGRGTKKSSPVAEEVAIAAVPMVEPPVVTHRRLHGAFWLCLHALLGPTLGVASLQMALKTTPSALVLSITAITPLLVVPLAWWLEGDKPTKRAFIGAVIAVAGVALAVNAK